MNNKTTLFIVTAVLFLASAAFFLKTLKGNAPKPSVEAQSTSFTSQNTGNVKEFTIDGTNYQFTPNTISVNKGDTVKITFKDDDGTHNLVIDSYGVSTNTIGGGGQDTIQFTADKAGEFEFYCSIGSHRDLGMTGKLIVN